MSTHEHFICIGLMSGTSFDGVDAVAADFSYSPPVVRGRAHCPFPDQFKEKLLALCKPGENEVERIGPAANKLAGYYAEAVESLLAISRIPRSDIQAIGAHGQTIRHRPEQRFSVQINNPALLAELTGIDVVADFRSADIAAGGQGAPLVPAFHERMFRGSKFRVIVNIGGIANLTLLPPAESSEPLSGFDCGPGNVLMDAWCSLRTGQPFDMDGAWAASGVCQNELLDSMLSDPYFALPPPKSTGRELFCVDWLKSHISSCGKRLMRNRDVQSTLLTLTARGIADAVTRCASPAEEVYVCGGGARNKALMSRIAALLPTRSVKTTEALGVDPMAVEGLAFAWLAYAWGEGIRGSCPTATGARGPRILGALYPASR